MRTRYPKVARACLKIAFCKMSSQFASDFMLDLGGVAGYIDQIQHKIWCEAGRQIVGMNFQTRSSIYDKLCERYLYDADSERELEEYAGI